MDRSCGLGMLAAGRWEPPEEVSLALLKVVTAVVSPRLWVLTAHFGYGYVYVFIRLMINIPIDSDCHGLLTRTQTQFLPKSLGKSDCCRPGVLDLDSMHFGFGSGGGSQSGNIPKPLPVVIRSVPWICALYFRTTLYPGRLPPDK